MKMFKCFSAKLAGYLIRAGFKLEGRETNFKYPQFDVFLFEDTQELRKAFDTYIINKKKA